MSPSNAASDIQQKVMEYIDAGAHQVGVVYHRTRSVAVHRSSSEASVPRENEIIEGGDALPGLSVPLSETFGA